MLCCTFLARFFLPIFRLEPKDVPECTADQDDLKDYCMPKGLEDMEKYGYVTPVLLGLYLLFTAILLLNMLIAIFT